MKTLIGRKLRRAEAKREPYVNFGQRDGGPRYLPPVSPIVQQALDQITRETLAKVRPKVIVWRDSPGCWLWIIGRRVGPNGYVRPTAGPGGHAPTQPAALALGLAALETATVHSASHRMGTR